MITRFAASWASLRARALPRPADPPLMTAVRFFQAWLDPMSDFTERFAVELGSRWLGYAVPLVVRVGYGVQRLR